MKSASLASWLGPRKAKLDEIENVLRALTRSRPARRATVEQVTQASVVLLASQFQAFCRDFHSECVDHLTAAAALEPLRSILRVEFLAARRLDRGTATVSNIGADFERLGIDFWGEVRRLDSRNHGRQRRVAELGGWRNAIAHQDFRRADLAPPRLRLASVRGWRRACSALAVSFDDLMRRYLSSVTGTMPW